MAASSLTSLSSLLQRSNLDDDEEVLRACNAALKKSKADLDAQHVKIIALLKLDRFGDALRLLQDGGHALQDRARVEFAYAQYKSGNVTEAAQLAAQIPMERGARHVEAQAAYRAENFLRTNELYKDLATEKGSGHEQNDLRINAGANNAQLEWKGLGDSVLQKKPGREDLEAFETAYNAACGSIARGELSHAEVLLKRAKDLCQASDELTAHDKADEILPISVQQLYVLSRLGKVDQAKKLALEISVLDIPDSSTKKVAQNNLLASTTQKNPYLSHRRFKEIPTATRNDMLFDFQSRLLRTNAYTLDLDALKYSGVVNSTLNAISKQPTPTTSPSVNTLAVLNAAAHAKSETGKSGLKHILPELEKRPNDVGLLLTVIQLYTLTNNHGAAISLLESFLDRLDKSISEPDEEVRFSPGLVALIVGLYKIQGRKKHVQIELAKVASYWRRKSKPPTALLRAAGKSLLESSNPGYHKEAQEVFARLHENKPDDHLTIAGYVASHASTSSASELRSLTSKLTPINRLTAGTNISALEDAGVPHFPSASPLVGKRPAEAQASRPAKKKPRKARIPKDYDPNKVPDPERWLPMRERSTYRPKGKKSKQKAAQMTQGGFTGAAEKAEDSGADAGKASGLLKSAGGGGGAKKKKAKGKK